MRRTHELRTKPIDDLTVEDLRLMIGQQIAVAHLVPQAVAVLEENPLAQGDFHPGDLLQAVLRIDGAYWQAHQDQWLRVHAVVDELLSAVEELSRSRPDPKRAGPARRVSVGRPPRKTRGASAADCAAVRDDA